MKFFGQNRFFPLYFVPAAVAFGAAHSFMPLYSVNQTTYFLHGLAKSGVGFLSNDWLAQTVDPFPVFSLLVQWTVTWLSAGFFYLYWFMLMGIYLYAITGIASRLFAIAKTPLTITAFLALVIFLHSSPFEVFGMRSIGFDLRQFFTWGVAGQYVLGPVLQPSMAGVFLVLSIERFLAEKYSFSVCTLALAAYLSSSYLFSATALAVSYAVCVFVQERNYRKIFIILLSTAALLAPIVIYDYLHFRATSPGTWNAALEILETMRAPHHYSPAFWFNTFSFLQIVLVLVALFTIRYTNAFWILFSATMICIVVSVLQVIFQSKSLAYLLPWRISAVIVPVSAAILAGQAVMAALQWRRSITWVRSPVTRKALLVGLVFLIVIVVLGGIAGTRNHFQVRRHDKDISMIDFARRNASVHDIYLIPPDLENFRLASGVPTFIDWKSHPYKDTEVVEWYERVEAAREVYNGHRPDATVFLKTLAAKYGITRLVAPTDSIPGNAVLLPEYHDRYFTIYRIVNE